MQPVKRLLIGLLTRFFEFIVSIVIIAYFISCLILLERKRAPEFYIAGHEEQAELWRKEIEKNDLKKNIDNEIKKIKDMEAKYFRLKNKFAYDPKEQVIIASEWEAFIYGIRGLYRGEEEEENRIMIAQIEKKFNDLLNEK